MYTNLGIFIRNSFEITGVNDIYLFRTFQNIAEDPSSLQFHLILRTKSCFNSI